VAEVVLDVYHQQGGMPGVNLLFERLYHWRFPLAVPVMPVPGALAQIV